VFDLVRAFEKIAKTAGNDGMFQTDKYKISDTQKAPWEGNVRIDTSKDAANDAFKIPKSKSPPWEMAKERQGDKIELFGSGNEITLNIADSNKPEASNFSRKDTPPLTEDDKKTMKEETGWPDEIIDSIASREEYEVYKNAGLEAKEINGKWCLIRTDIDWDQEDEYGRTNKERAEQGLAPLDKTGKPIELHHIGQNPDSPLAELTQEEHRGKGNSGILHDNSQESQIDREKFNDERSAHWEARSTDV
jgi:hypothetical protein